MDKKSFRVGGSIKIDCSVVMDIVATHGIMPSNMETIQFNGHKGYLDAVIKAIKIHTAKNIDYSGGGGPEDDPLSNFKGSVELGIDPVNGIMLRMSDKFQRVKAFVKNGKMAVEDESVDDALLDIANYAFLAIALRSEGIPVEDSVIEITMYAYTQGGVIQSITEIDIAQALQAEDYKIKAQDIALDSQITKYGDYTASIRNSKTIIKIKIASELGDGMPDDKVEELSKDDTLEGRDRWTSLTIVVGLQNNEMYDSINQDEIAARLGEEQNIIIAPTNILMDTPIKALGLYKIPINMPGEHCYIEVKVEMGL